MLRQVTIEIDQVEGSSDEGPRGPKVEALRAQLAAYEVDQGKAQADSDDGHAQQHAEDIREEINDQSTSRSGDSGSKQPNKSSKGIGICLEQPAEIEEQDRGVEDAGEDAL